MAQHRSTPLKMSTVWILVWNYSRTMLRRSHWCQFLSIFSFTLAARRRLARNVAVPPIWSTSRSYFSSTCTLVVWFRILLTAERSTENYGYREGSLLRLKCSLGSFQHHQITLWLFAGFFPVFVDNFIVDIIIWRIIFQDGVNNMNTKPPTVAETH